MTRATPVSGPRLKHLLDEDAERRLPSAIVTLNVSSNASISSPLACTASFRSVIARIMAN